MDNNTTTMPNWAKDILDALKCDESKTFVVGEKTIYFGVSSSYDFSVDEDDKEGKPVYVVTYSRRDHLMPDDEDKNAIVNRLVTLLGKPVDFREGLICDYLEFNRKVN